MRGRAVWRLWGHQPPAQHLPDRDLHGDEVEEDVPRSVFRDRVAGIEAHISHDADENPVKPRKFLVDVEETVGPSATRRGGDPELMQILLLQMKLVLAQEDTDANFQVRRRLAPC